MDELHTEDYIFLVILVILMLIGIAGNVRLIIRNKGFKCMNSKSGDIELLTSLLALFNIFYLLDVIPISAYIIWSDFEYSVGAGAPVACYILRYYEHFAKFGVYYFMALIARQCFLLLKDAPESSKSSRRKILLVTLLTLLFYALFLTFFGLGFQGVRTALGEAFRGCFGYLPYASIFRELLLLPLVITAVVFTIINATKTKTLRENQASMMHTIIQSKKITIVYSLAFVPYFLFRLSQMIIAFGDLHDYYYDVRAVMAIRIVLDLIDMISCVIFPFIWKIYPNIAAENDLS